MRVMKAEAFTYIRNTRTDLQITQEAIMTRDELNRELRMHSASWQAVLIVYAMLFGTFVLSAMAMVA